MNKVKESLPGSPGALVPAFALDWEYPVWQLRFDTASGLVAVESRDADTLQASFSIFKTNTGELVLRDYKPVNAWWTALTEIRAGLFYLQGIATKGVGRPVGITAVTIATGQVKWERPEFSFYGSTATEILVRTEEDSVELTSLNPDSGEVTGSGITIDDIQAQLAIYRQPVQVPRHYPAANKYFLELKEFIFQKTGLEAHYAIDYLENQKYIVLGFYPKTNNPNQIYRLVLFTLIGECLLQEDLGKELTGISPDNFFIFQDTLILIKNKKSLLGYAV